MLSFQIFIFSSRHAFYYIIKKMQFYAVALTIGWYPMTLHNKWVINIIVFVAVNASADVDRNHSVFLFRSSMKWLLLLVCHATLIQPFVLLCGLKSQVSWTVLRSWTKLNYQLAKSYKVALHIFQAEILFKKNVWSVINRTFCKSN